MTNKLLLASAALSLSLMTGAHAFAGTVVLTDNFDSDAYANGDGYLNWPGDASFTSTSPAGQAAGPASVDLIGAGSNFDFFSGVNGKYVDLDGSSGYGNTPVAGQLSSNTSFAAGSYTLSFDLAGNQRGASDKTTDVSLGGVLIDSIGPLASNAAFSTYDVSFKTTGGVLAFTENGPSDQQGNLLDNVVLTQVSAAPEPSVWALMIAGVAMIGGALRLNRRRDAMIVA